MRKCCWLCWELCWKERSQSGMSLIVKVFTAFYYPWEHGRAAHNMFSSYKIHTLQDNYLKNGSIIPYELCFLRYLLLTLRILFLESQCNSVPLLQNKMFLWYAWMQEAGNVTSFVRQILVALGRENDGLPHGMKTEIDSKNSSNLYPFVASFSDTHVCQAIRLN